MKKISFAAVIVLFTIASCTKKATPTISKETAIDGAPLYAQNCAKCHGVTGVEGRAPNLSKNTYSKSEIAGTITNGAGRMPAFSDKLSSREIDAVAEFVTHLKK